MKGLRSSLGLAFLVASSLVACGGTFKGGSDNAGGSGGGAGTGSGGRDGCNNCRCGKGGSISCTDKACYSCQDMQTSYARAVEEARKCDPQSNNQCRGKLSEGLQCSCGVFVDEANVDAIAAAKRDAASYATGNCGGGVLCGACATPVGGYCSQAGRCETLWQEEPRACKVGGVVYPDGATGIPDPTSCNKCTCSDGELSCTEINCPTPCPTEHGFASQCALCGPTDECLIVEHACLPTCSPDGPACAEGACSAGICRNRCG